jgi:hypothetical protein
VSGGSTGRVARLHDPAGYELGESYSRTVKGGTATLRRVTVGAKGLGRYAASS